MQGARLESRCCSKYSSSGAVAELGGHSSERGSRWPHIDIENGGTCEGQCREVGVVSLGYIGYIGYIDYIDYIDYIGYGHRHAARRQRGDGASHGRAVVVTWA